MSHSAIDTGGQSTTEQVTRQAQDAAGQVADKTREATAQARQQAAQTTRQAKGMLRGQVDQRSTQLGQQVTGQAADMRSVAEQLRQQGKDTPARVAERLADRAEQVGGYLQRSDADQILDDVEDFVRSKPWAVAAGALGLGFAAARFLKASSSRRYQAASRPSAQPTPKSWSPATSTPQPAVPPAEPYAEPYEPYPPASPAAPRAPELLEVDTADVPTEPFPPTPPRAEPLP